MTVSSLPPCYIQKAQLSSHSENVESPILSNKPKLISNQKNPPFFKSALMCRLGVYFTTITKITRYNNDKITITPDRIILMLSRRSSKRYDNTALIN